MASGNPLMPDDLDYQYLKPRGSHMLERSKSLRHAESIAARRVSNLSGRYSSETNRGGRTMRIASLPSSTLQEATLERIRRFAPTLEGGLMNIGDSKRKSIRRSSILSTTNTDGSLTEKVEMEIVELDNGEVKKVAVYHVVMAGRHNVGKHSLIRQFLSSEYKGVYATIDGSVDVENKAIPVIIGDEEIRLQIFTVDIEKMGTLLASQDAYLIVYDVTDRKSFEIAGSTLKQICDYPTILVGNKSDLVRNRQVTKKASKVIPS